MSSIRCVAIVAVALTATVPAAAEDSDTGVWLTATVRGNITDDVAVSVDAIARFSNDRDGLSQAIGRGQMGYRVNQSISVEGGYGRFLAYDDGRVTQREHRFYQHLVWRMGSALGGRWTARTRLEQRLVQQADTTGIRLRQRIAYARPLSDNVTLGASTEAFFALNDTDFVARSGFDTLRSTAGVTWAVSGAIDLELGYVNQWQSRRDRTDVLLHAANMGLAFKF